MARETKIADGTLVVEEGILGFSVDLFRLMEGLDVDGARQMAEAITWDSILDQAVCRLTGKGENSSSMDERMTLGVLAEMEYGLADRSWAILRDVVDVARQIRAREKMWPILAQLRHLTFLNEGRNEPQREELKACVDALEKELKTPLYLDRDESLNAFKNEMEGKFKEAFPEKHHAQLETEAFMRVSCKVGDLLREVMARLTSVHIVGSWNRERADQVLGGLSYEAANELVTEFRRLLGLHPEVLEEGTPRPEGQGKED